MLLINRNFNLKALNTFGIDVSASFFAEIQTIEELVEAIQRAKELKTPLLILGGGSNILFTSSYDGFVLKPSIQTIEELHSDDFYVDFRVGAGIIWDSFVEFAVSKGLGGIENLSLIPGCVGASPIQNIGAYGVEVKDCIVQVEGIRIDTLEPIVLTNSECRFGYRNSIFKNELKGKVVITNVVFRLNRFPRFTTNYGNLEAEIEKVGIRTVESVRRAVVNIRNSKLPDPKVLGNAGSFFKNPEVSNDIATKLKEQFNHMPVFPVNDFNAKIPAGWLIEQCGWKGRRIGEVGVFKDQALVLVNHGKAKGHEVIELAKAIQQSVARKFGIELEMEVNVM